MFSVLYLLFIFYFSLIINYSFIKILYIGYCPPKNIQQPNPKCTYKALIQDIAKYVEYVTDKKGLEMSAGIPKFSVASTV